MQEHDILLGCTADGRYIKLPGTEHVALHARTGSGKTSQFVIPNCYAWKGSLVVLDIKSEAFQATAAHRYAMGQDIYLFNPTAEDGRSHRWNPFASIDRLSIERFDAISRAAFQLFPEGADQSNATKFWIPAGRSAFTAVAGLIAETPGMDFTVANVLRLFTRGDGFDWLTNAIRTRRDLNDPYTAPVVDGITDFMGGGMDLVESIRKTVSTSLQTFYNPKVSTATEISDIDLRQLRRRPMTIYLSVNPASMPRMRPLLRLFFDRLINDNVDKTPQQDSSLTTPVLVLLDEFARLGHVTTLAEAAQYVRGFGLRMIYVMQNKAQIRAIYGKDGAADIFDNLGAEIVFGTADPELTKELEERLGDDTVLFSTRSRPRFFSFMHPAKQHLADHPHRRPLMLDQEIVRLPPDEQLIIRAGMKPMKTKRMVWYTDRNFKDLEADPPTIPKLDVRISMDDISVPVPVRRR